MKALVGIVIATVVLCACAMAPRVSSWQSPHGFSKKQVFNAAISAGGQSGLRTTASDRESGTISFSKTEGKGQEMNLSVQIIDASGIIKVQTTAAFTGGVAIAGTHEVIINNFHVFLFRNLNISDPTAMNVKIEEI